MPTRSPRNIIEKSVITKGLIKNIAELPLQKATQQALKKVKLAKTTASPRKICIPKRCIFKIAKVLSRGINITSNTNNPTQDRANTI